MAPISKLEYVLGDERATYIVSKCKEQLVVWKAGDRMERYRDFGIFATVPITGSENCAQLVKMAPMTLMMVLTSGRVIFVKSNACFELQLTLVKCQLEQASAAQAHLVDQKKERVVQVVSDGWPGVTMALTAAGCLYYCTSKVDENEDKYEFTHPVDLVSFRSVKNIAVLEDCFLALRTDGSIYIMSFQTSSKLMEQSYVQSIVHVPSVGMIGRLQTPPSLSLMTDYKMYSTPTAVAILSDDKVWLLAPFPNTKEFGSEVDCSTGFQQLSYDSALSTTNLGGTSDLKPTQLSFTRFSMFILLEEKRFIFFRAKKITQLGFVDVVISHL